MVRHDKGLLRPAVPEEDLQTRKTQCLDWFLGVDNDPRRRVSFEIVVIAEKYGSSTRAAQPDDTGLPAEEDAAHYMDVHDYHRNGRPDYASLFAADLFGKYQVLAVTRTGRTGHVVRRLYVSHYDDLEEDDPVEHLDQKRHVPVVTGMYDKLSLVIPHAEGLVP